MTFPFAIGLAAAAASSMATTCPRTLTEVEFARPLDEGERAALVAKLAGEVQRLYVDEAGAARIAATLRKHQRQGRYRGLSSPGEFAFRLTSDILAVVPDQHLKVRARIIEADAPPVRAAETASEIQARRERFRRGAAYDGYGLRHLQIMPGNVGYLQLGEFWTPQVSGDALTSAMAVLKDVDALIIDLRESYGGHEGVVSLLMGYFVRTPRQFFEQTDRSTGKSVQGWTAPYVPGTPDSLFREDVLVYVLTSSRRTFSAAEALALALRQQRSAVIVGESTKGGANGGEFRAISCRFDAFIPHVRSEVGGVNWEAIGVRPDIAVPEADALNTAYRQALSQLADRPLPEEADALAREIKAEREQLLQRK